MTVSSLSALNSTQQQQAVRNASAKLQAAIASIVSGKRSDDIAALSIAAQLQSQTSGLKQIASNIAQASSLSQVAEGGVQQIHGALEQLRTLAQAAKSPVLTAENRKQLNDQFQQLTKAIDGIAKATSFNSKSLLDGALSGDNGLSLDTLLSGSGGSTDLSIGALTSSSLLGGSLDILSVDSADDALTAITAALGKTTSTRVDIGSFLQTLDFAGANLDTAIANQEAAQSTLTDTDFASASTGLSLANLQQNAAIALAAQGNKLSPVLLQLIA